jgi:hypothetical protein
VTRPPLENLASPGINDDGDSWLAVHSQGKREGRPRNPVYVIGRPVDRVKVPTWCAGHRDSTHFLANHCVAGKAGGNHFADVALDGDIDFRDQVGRVRLGRDLAAIGVPHVPDDPFGQLQRDFPGLKNFISGESPWSLGRIPHLRVFGDGALQQVQLVARDRIHAESQGPAHGFQVIDGPARNLGPCCMDLFDHVLAEDHVL